MAGVAETVDGHSLLDPWCALDFDVDEIGLREEVERCEARWAPQATASVNQRVRSRGRGDWTVVPLLAPSGDARRTDPGLPGEEYARTVNLDAMPRLSALISALPCEKMCARLLKLSPSASIKQHVDAFFGFSYGKVRLHVPLVTTPTALMVFGERSVHWSPGRLWYGDFSTPHTVLNNGTADRIHLVVDCVLSADLLDRFPDSHLLPAMISRTALDPPPAPPIARGDWVLTVPGRAFDWSGSSDAALDVPVRLNLTVRDEVLLTMPSGVAARLRAVDVGCYRLGRMPEETLVCLDASGAHVRRRAGDDIRIFEGSLTPD